MQNLIKLLNLVRFPHFAMQFRAFVGKRCASDIYQSAHSKNGASKQGGIIFIENTLHVPLQCDVKDVWYATKVWQNYILYLTENKPD